MKLYELTSGYVQLLDMLEDTDGDQTAILDTLESIREEINVKAENVAKLIKSLEPEAEAIRAEEMRLAERRRVLESRQKSLKTYLEQQLQTAGIDKVKGTTFTVAMQNNAPAVNVEDETHIPEQFFVIKRDIDRNLLKAALKSGQEIPGVALVQSKSLRIR